MWKNPQNIRHTLINYSAFNSLQLLLSKFSYSYHPTLYRRQRRTMVKYSVSTAALFAITSLSATTINAEGLVKTSAVRAVVDEVEQQRLRKLYASVATSSHFVTDVETKCNEVIAGNPPVCVNVCETVTTIKSGDKVVEQTSKASQTKCAETTVVGVASEEWAGDGYTEVTVKNDSWKCTETVRSARSYYS